MPLAGQPLEQPGVHPAPLGHDPVDGSGRPGPGGRQDGRHVQHLAPAHGLGPARLPEHVPVAGQQGKRLSQVDAQEPDLAGADAVAPDDPDARRVLPRADVCLVGAAPADVVAEGGQHGERAVEGRRGRPPVRLDQRVAALDVVVADPGQVDGEPAARGGPVDRRRVALKGADPDRGAGREDDELVVDRYRAAGQRARHHRPRPPCRERPVDPQPGPPPIRRGGRGFQQPVEGAAQLVDPDALDRVHVHDLGAGEERPRHPVGHIEMGELAPLVVDRPDLGEGDEPVADPE